MKTKLTIKIFTLIAVVVNLASIVLLDFFYSQIVRLSTSCSFLILFIVFKFKDKLLVPFAALLFIADVFDLYYKQPYIIEIYSVIKIGAFLLLCFSLYRKMKNKKLDKALSVLFLVVIIINLLFGYTTVNTVSGAMTISELLSIQVYWFVCIISVALAAKYYFYTESKEAVYLILFTFLFVFTDLCGFIANFIEINGFFYFERILYCLGFYFLSAYLFYDLIKGRMTIAVL
ncbi:hypothetical protein [Psychroserpens sp. NJDZ02]|uniref:hypothetical protein n=1 Tax=Psychroserpens sp. NJDZ02 TaxID=2570561 RepID=UPI0010A8B6E9|nr:hypothetical protein [Psychroserpens sp. NJDZ02]QCE42022.1 hypothetical protein E9099_11615 [Psychroserpens sp. NJDZ02]